MTSICLQSDYGAGGSNLAQQQQQQQQQLSWQFYPPSHMQQQQQQQQQQQALPPQPSPYQLQPQAPQRNLLMNSTMRGPLDDLKFELLAPFEQEESAAYGCYILGGSGSGDLSPGSDSTGVYSAITEQQQAQPITVQQQPHQPIIDEEFLFECVTPPEPAKPEPLSPTDPAASVGVVSSSSGSLNGGVGPQRRAPRPREDKICGVCGDKALGFNFDAVSCESCKAFFRRNAGRGVAAFKCPYEGHCIMDVSNRRFCKRCRLRKCFEVGMKKEYILSEEEKQVKRKKIDQNKLVRSLEALQLLPKDLPAEELSQRELLTEAELAELRGALDSYASSEACVLPPQTPSDRPAAPVGVDDLINFAELSVLRVIDLSKRLEPFRRLSQQDKVALLKGGAMELILLRGVISFDPDGARFLDAADADRAASLAMDGADFLHAAGASGQALLRLAAALRIGMRADRPTLVLLLLVCLFSPDRPALTPDGRAQVEATQTGYCQLLERLLRTRHAVAEARRLYPQLLAQLAELRCLERQFASLAGRANARLVRPLMAEFLDLQEEAAAASSASEL